MDTLHVLGGAWLDRAGERLEGAASQRHRLALLARLAAKPDRTLSREVLATLLWPERGQKESRHLLNVSVHAIRQALGDNVLVSLGRDLQLDTQAIACDLIKFREALQRGDPDAALQFVGGPFLDGFFVDQAEEFQQWQDQERARVTREVADALHASAEAAERRGDMASARDAWRRLVEHEPHSATATVRLMRLLEASGQGAAALHVADEHIALMANEFDAQPHPDVVQLADRMRERPAALHSADVVSSSQPPAVGNQSDVTVSSVSDSLTPTSPRVRRRWPSRSAAAFAIAVVAIIGAFAVVTNRGERPDDVTRQPPVASVAVLPFQDFSEGGGHEYLANGIAEELLNELAGIRGLFVPARSSSFRFREPAVDIADVGRQLDVAHILEGSVRRDGDRLRVTAQLIDARTNYHVWSEQFDRTITDLLSVQQEIAGAIASRLRLTLEKQGAPLSAHADVDPLAYDFYLRGRFAWSQRSPSAMQEALDAFERAIAIEPGYAAAWAGMAAAWMLLPDHGGVPTREGLTRAKTAAQRAVALNPGYAPAHASLGHVIDDLDRNRAAAAESFRKSIRLDPAYASARQWYGLHLANGGHFAEALAELEEARRLDPLSSIINTAVGAVRYFARDWDGAIAEYEAVIRADTTFAVAWALLGRVHLVAGRPDVAVSALRTAVSLSNGDPSYKAVLATALIAQGKRSEGEATVKELLTVPNGAYVPRIELAPALLALDKTEDAMELYESGWDELDTATKHLFVEPLHDPAREHPRFQALVAQLGLPES